MAGNDFEAVPFIEEDPLYILYTSGSTGKPKGVVITRGNFNAYIHAAINDIGYNLSPDSKWLQPYELTFDASLQCYVLPLCFGSCIYTVPHGGIKYLQAYKIMQKHGITHAKFTPSMVAFLRPYFPSIDLPEIRFCIFGGEPLKAEMVKAWSKCIPNGKIQNIYGPTEASVNCICYDVPRENFLQHNGIIALGKPFGDTKAIIAGENNELLPRGEEGELFLSGPQVSPGYYNHQEKNSSSFVLIPIENEPEKFYKTGDRAFMDGDGNVFFIGRVDKQVQMEGYRVEPGEIEYHVSLFTGGAPAIVVPGKTDTGTTSLELYIEGNEVDTEKLKEYLRQKLPAYMQPSAIIIQDQLPRNLSGKIDIRKITGER